MGPLVTGIGASLAFFKGAKALSNAVQKQPVAQQPVKQPDTREQQRGAMSAMLKAA